MKIIKATYGTKDVTDIIKSKLINDTLVVQASNSIFGDPNFGVVKSLSILIENNNNIVEHKCSENEIIFIPQLKHDRLGIFCSNNFNNKTKNTIKKSLETIQVASSNKADIITCLWNSEDYNPFIDIQSKVKNVYGNLNYQLQILQCLYFAKNNHNYRYVSFLEHDVLYSDGHFDYLDFNEDYISNNNYIGLNTKGFQRQKYFHYPLSQITMNFNFAIQYFLNNIGMSLYSGLAAVEPHNQKYESKHKIILNEHSNVHVNHGHAFTSHYMCFSDETYLIDDYWGHHNQYLNLFN